MNFYFTLISTVDEQNLQLSTKSTIEIRFI
jgi:hypothetical protein